MATNNTTPTKTSTKAPTKTPTARIAAMLALCPEAIEVKIVEDRGIAVRLKVPLADRSFEVPMLVHVDELTVFDVYPFRFVGVDAAKVDWVRILRLCRSGYVQLGLDQDFEDEDVVVYSFPIPCSSLDATMVKTVVGTLTAFAGDNYDDVMAATGLVERRR